MSEEFPADQIVYDKPISTTKGKRIVVRAYRKQNLISISFLVQNKTEANWGVQDHESYPLLSGVSFRDAKKWLEAYLKHEPLPCRPVNASEAYTAQKAQEYCHGETWVSNSKWLVRRLPETELICTQLEAVEKRAKEKAGLKFEPSSVNAEELFKVKNTEPISGKYSVFTVDMQPVVLFEGRPDGEKHYGHCAHTIKLFDKYMGSKTHEKRIQVKEDWKAFGVLYYVNKQTLQVDAVLMPRLFPLKDLRDYTPPAKSGAIKEKVG